MKNLAALCVGMFLFGQTVSFAQDEGEPLATDLTRGQIAEFELLNFGAAKDRGILRSFRFPDNADDGIYGFDVSHHNGDIDWKAVANRRVQFVYIKASQGTNGFDNKFATNWVKAKEDAGLARGAYHFLSAGLSGEAQAANFLKRLKAANGGSTRLGDGDLAPVLDIEWDFASSNETRQDRWAQSDPEEIVAVALAWLKIVEDATGRKPIIYTAASWWKPRLGKNLALQSYSHWIADYRASRTTPASVQYHKVLAWQFTDVATVSGVVRRFDANKIIAGDLGVLAGRSERH